MSKTNVDARKPLLSYRMRSWIRRLSWTVVLLSPFIAYITLYRRSVSEVEFTVDHRERVTTGSGDSMRSYYLVWSKEGEVFCVVDSYSFMKFDSSDRYGKLAEGNHVRANVAGWRIPFLSMYRNVIGIEPITGHTDNTPAASPADTTIQSSPTVAPTDSPTTNPTTAQ